MGEAQIGVSPSGYTPLVGTTPLTTKGDLLTLDAGGLLVRRSVGPDGYGLVADAAEATGMKWVPLAGSGTVTSVGLALPTDLFTVSGTPVAGAGTLTAAKKTQVKNTLFAGPTSGADAAPNFRALTANDLSGVAPALSGSRTAGKLPKWNGTDTLTDSTVYVDPTTGFVAVGFVDEPGMLLGIGSPLVGLSNESATDLGLYADGVLALQIGPTTGGVQKQARFKGPVMAEPGALGAFGVTETVRVHFEALAGAYTRTVYNGLNVLTPQNDGSSLTIDGFIHAVNVDINANSPQHLGASVNEVAAGEFWMTQHGYGKVFGLEAFAISAADAPEAARDAVGIGCGVAVNCKLGGETNAFAVLASNDSLRGPTGTGVQIGVKTQRNQLNDVTAGTITVVNGSVDVVGDGSTAWLTSGAAPYLDLTGRKILIAGTIYLIDSVSTDHALKLTTPYGGAGAAGLAYKIQGSPSFGYGILVNDCGAEGLVFHQDVDFPPGAGDAAIRVKNVGLVGDAFSIDYAGNINASSAARAGWFEASGGPPITAGKLGLGNSFVATVGAAGGAAALPGAPETYLVISDGTRHLNIPCWLHV